MHYSPLYVRLCDTVTLTILLYMSGYVIQLHALFPFIYQAMEYSYMHYSPLYIRLCDTVTFTIPLYISGYVIQLHALFPFICQAM